MFSGDESPNGLPLQVNLELIHTKVNVVTKG